MNKQMLLYIAKRLAQTVVTFFGIITIVFFVIHMIPADPVKIMYGDGALSKNLDLELVEEIRKMYHLDKPIYVQYGIWLSDFLRLDFGNSMFDGRSVLDKIAESLPLTLTLNILSMVMSLLAAIPLGIISALKHGTRFDRNMNLFLLVLYALPTFWVALMLISFFGVTLDILPFYGLVSDNHETMSFFGKMFDIASHLVMPLFCYMYGSLTFMSRLTKANVLDTLSQEFIKTARAKGLSEKAVVMKHALRNSMISLITVFSTLLPSLIGGSVIIERIFSLPGMGLMMFNSIRSFDYPVIMTVLAISAILTLVNILIVDILYVVINPRISYAQAEN